MASLWLWIDHKLWIPSQDSQSFITNIWMIHKSKSENKRMKKVLKGLLLSPKDALETQFGTGHQQI